MNPPRILVVEDEFIVAQDLANRLADLGYAVADRVNSGLDAVRSASASDVDLVLMDIQLKGEMDGIAAAREIRKLRSIPILFLTAFAEETVLQRALAAAPFGYLVKPFDDRDLRATIEIALYKHKAEEDLRRVNRLYATLSQINQLIVRTRCLDELLAAVCRVAVSEGRLRLAWIGRLDRATRAIRPVACYGDCADYVHRLELTVGDPSGEPGLTATAILSNQECVCNDFASDPRVRPWRRLILAKGFGSAIALPLHQESNVWGALMLYAAEPGFFREPEVELAREVAEDISFAMYHLELETQRKLAEEQLRKLARAVDQSPASIVITDRAGRIEFVNPKFTQTTGYRAEEAMGQNPRILKSGETSAADYRGLWETITAGREWRGEFHNRRKDGTLYWERASISPIRGGDGEITHFIAVKEDVTEKRLTEAKLLRAQRVESVGSLASGIAHDLNNILTPIVICGDLLQAETDAGRCRELAHTIQSSALRAVGVVKQLLGFARGREGEKTLVQPRHLIGEVVGIARETFTRSIVVEQACAPDLWPVLANGNQLHQVLLNLCLNARDAMPEGGRLTLRATNVALDECYAAMHQEATPGSHVLIEVSDTGTGIPEVMQARLFESFFTTKGEDQGTGLGLTTSRGIVRDHGGFITFTSVPGRGTTFRVHLPAQPDTLELARSASPQPVPSPGHGELLLVVDDEAGIRDAIGRILELQGYRVLQASDGIEALAQFSTHSAAVALVVTDFMMPLMDGLTLCRTLRRLDSRIPLLVSSGALPDSGRAGTQEAFEALGNCHLLPKPHTAAELLRAVWNILHPTEARERTAGVDRGSSPPRP